MITGFRLRASGSGLFAALWVSLAHAQPAPLPVNLTASTVNVSESGAPVKIRILRWSTDEERTPVVAALTPAAPATAAAGAEANPSSAAGDGGRAARGGRGGAGRAGAGRAGRGGAGRGGRGEAAPSPTAALTAAISRAPTLGYVWTNDVTGYAIKYAYHASLPDGGERIILATDRRLGAHTAAWKPVTASPATDYEFTLIEIRLDSRGAGGGKTSLTAKVTLDNDAKTVALDDYAATPAILENVKR